MRVPLLAQRKVQVLLACFATMLVLLAELYSRPSTAARKEVLYMTTIVVFLQLVGVCVACMQPPGRSA